MSDTSAVQKDVAGVPIWIWGAGVAALVVLYTYIHRATTASATTAVTGTDTTPLDSSLNDFTSSSGSGGITSATSTTPQTNSEWLAAVEQTLQQQGYDPLTILSDLTGFINGDQVQEGSAQAKVVSAALATSGLPPQMNASPNFQPITYTSDVQAAARALDPTSAADFATYEQNIGSYANQQQYLQDVNIAIKKNNLQNAPAPTV